MPEKRKKSCIFFIIFCCCVLAAGCSDSSPTKTVVLMESSAPEQTTENAAPEITETDWYGWWKMYNTSGDWAHMYGYRWDCCAEMSENGSMLIWDEDMPRNDFLALLLTERDGDAILLTGGSFLDRTLEKDGLKLVLTKDKSEELLTVSGHYDAVGNGGFDFEMYLRPWGAVWQCDEDELPYRYSDWYLPLIENGSPMPDSFD